MGKKSVLFLILILIFMLCACGKENPPVTAEPEDSSSMQSGSTSLSETSKGTIGIIISDMSNSLPYDIEKGIEDVLKENDYSFILLDSKGRDINDVINMQDILKENVIAIIYNPISSDISGDVVRLATAKNIPVITVGCLKGDGSTVSNVSSDFYRVGQKAGEVLSKKYGNNSTAVAQIPCMNSTTEIDEFISGFNTVIQSQGNFTLKQPRLGDGIEESAQAFIEKAFEDNVFEAFFTADVDDALQVVKTADDKGVECPTIISFGYSDEIDKLIKEDKPILTFSQQGEKMGNLAAGKIIEYLNGKTLENQIYVDANAVMSESFYKSPTLIKIA